MAVLSAAVSDVQDFAAAWERGIRFDALDQRRLDAFAAWVWLFSPAGESTHKLTMAEVCEGLELDAGAVRSGIIDKLPDGAADAILHGDRPRCTSSPASAISASHTNAIDLAKSGASAALA